MSDCPYIDRTKKYWGREFAGLLGIEYRPEYDEIAGIGAFTMLYEVANNFRNGEFEKEIQEFFRSGSYN